MGNERAHDPVDEIETLLDQIGEALKQGQLAALSGFEDRLALLEPALAEADQDRLIGILAKAERNQRLLRAAGRGVRSAQRRLTEIARSLQGLSTYDRKGRLQARGDGMSLLSKRF
ncbi:MAG: hypothetical protein JNN06_02220 [Gemmobacter sp.]|uniref:hypothetical protein n=1 Tax=Gemmobacter sp. TaxID=1898957 RepID=UPI001A583CBE|nr:hypothetical protein [Gemmobacter sp.]MBL8561071.1 hypothetical protein [Gemmobacter sp.]